MPAPSPEPTHVVCDCQWNAVPRYALCGADVTHTPEGNNGVRCIICKAMTPAALAAGCCGRCA